MTLASLALTVIRSATTSKRATARNFPPKKPPPRSNVNGSFHITRSSIQTSRERFEGNAASSYKGTSLNDHLLTGPDLLNSLIGILMRFREERVALSADIESMLSQVVVPAEDQTVLRFLWREHQSSAPDVYQYCRHIFGAKSSPTSVNYVLRQTAEDNRREFPKAAETVGPPAFLHGRSFHVGGE